MSASFIRSSSVGRSAVHRSSSRSASLAVLLTLLSGCSMAPYRYPAPQPSPAPPSGESAGEAPAPAPQPPQATASTALLEESRTARSEGRYAQATASLERALRIDPNNPLLWIELAEVKAADGDSGQAREMARKALTLADGDGSIESRARRLL